MPPRIKSGPGQCLKCDKTYADLLEHITKKHRHDKFQQPEVDSAGLVACICGRVVLNRDGLLKHQARFSCLGSLERSTGPTVVPAQSQASSSLTSLPTTRLSLPAPPSLSAVSTLTAPSISTATSTLTSLPSTAISPVAIQPIPILDSPVRDWYDEVQPISGNDWPSSINESVYQSPSLSTPSSSCSPHSATPARMIEPEDAPPLTLEWDDVAAEEVEESLDMDLDNDQEGEVGINAPVLDLPYKDEFITLTNLSADSECITKLDPQPVDVDRWELVISPEEYLQRFKDTLATVQLANRAPHRRMHTTYHRGPGFDRWLLLAQANHQIWIDPRYKDGFFDKLGEYQTAQPGRLAQQASLGSVHLSTTVFVHCLRAARCDTIRLKAYGQKTPLVDRFVTKEPAQLDHRWAEHNEWDIGQIYQSPHIWLFASATGRTHGVTHYPMVIPGSGGYGTVNMKLSHEARHYSIKVYPKVIHVIKSFNSRLQGAVPKTLQGVRNQVAASLRMIHSLTSKDDKALGGFRIEVTVKAPSLREAHRLVKSTGFLDPSYWLGLGEGPHPPTRLSAQLVTREGLLANGNWVFQQAAQASLFEGRGSDRPTRAQIQALTDILNGLGWNSGLRSPTKSMDPEAWWHSHTPSTDRAAIFQHLMSTYQSDQEILEMFETARSGAHPFVVPCKSAPGYQSHRYQIHERSPFRVRCSNKECRHKLQRTALVHWIAELIQEGVIDGTGLGV